MEKEIILGKEISISPIAIIFPDSGVSAVLGAEPNTISAALVSTMPKPDVKSKTLIGSRTVSLASRFEITVSCIKYPIANISPITRNMFI